MNNTAETIHRYTEEEYFEMTKDSEQMTELLDGQIVAMSSPGIRHNTITQNLHFQLKSFVLAHDGKCRPFAAPTDVKLNDFTVVVPDVFVTCTPENFDSQKLNGAPDFVAEVVSSNRSDDFIRKLYLYRNNGVREYWIIDPKNEKVYVYFFEEDSSPEIYDFHTPIPVRIWDGELCITVAELEML